MIELIETTVARRPIALPTQQQIITWCDANGWVKSNDRHEKTTQNGCFSFKTDISTEAMTVMVLRCIAYAENIDIKHLLVSMAGDEVIVGNVSITSSSTINRSAEGGFQ